MKKDSKNHVIGRWMRRLTATLALACMTVFAYAQQRVTGTVTDSAGEPIIGASVVVEGTTVGMTTGVDGDFSLNVPANGKLVVSFLGYKTVTVPVAGKTAVNVTLEEDVAMLDDVVVIGYGVVKKRDLTGAVSSVKAETITMTPTSNPMEALQGRVAGLDITKTSGQAGQGVNMQLRGNRSLPAITDDDNARSKIGNPLFIIDGMPGDYSTLNPNDIESIEVLKDASSTAIYGSDGANGVVLITTKSGKAGKVNVNFNAYAGFNGWSKLPALRQGESYIQTRRDAYLADGGAWSSPADDRKLFVNDEAYQQYADGKWINWPDVLMHNSYTQNYSLSVSGGNEKTQAYLSFNFSDEKGQYKNDDYKVYSTNAKIKHTFNKWLAIGTNIQASYTHQNSRSNVKLDRAMNSIPLGDMYNEDGSINPYPSAEQGAFINPLLDEGPGVFKNLTNNTKLSVNPYVEITPVAGLSIISRLNATLNNSRHGTFNGYDSYNYYQNGATATAVTASMSQSHNYNYKWENIVTYNFTVADDHAFTLTGVTSWSHNQYEQYQLSGNQIPDNKFLWYNLGSSDPSTRTVYSTYNMSKDMGIVGRVNYSYKGKYLFSASMRWDGASRLAKGNQWSSFPAVSAGWRISEEKFMENTKSWLDNLKLRVGYGVSGTTDAIGPYASASSLVSDYLTVGNQLWPTYYYSATKANPALSWEKTYNTNIGLDATFFNGRIDLTADYYISKTKDVIYSRMMPYTMGGANATTAYNTNVNICQTQNQGFEFTLNTRNIVKKDFTWTSTVTFATNKEKIVALTDPTQTEIISGNRIYRIGEPINSFYHYKLDGIWQLGEEADAAVFGCVPGDVKINVPGMTKVRDGVWAKTLDDGTVKEFTAADGEGYTYSADDYQVLGHNSPDWTLGFQNTFTWKNFDLSIYMYMRWGQMINYGLLTSYDPSGKQNFPAYFNYWTPENPSNDFPAASGSKDITSYTGFPARAFVDGSFFKIKNITLGYTLPEKTLRRAGISKFRVYATITNPLIVAKSHLIKDYDPEMNGSFTYPLTKQLVFGVNFTF